MKTDLKFADCFSGVVSCQFSQISSLLCTGTHLTVKDWPDKGSTAFRKLHFAHISTDYKLHITQVTFSETITFIMLYDTSMLSSIANNEKTTCSHAAEEGYIFQISRILQPRFLSALCPGLRPSIRGFFCHYYFRAMLDSLASLSCSKLCWHNVYSPFGHRRL